MIILRKVDGVVNGFLDGRGKKVAIWRFNVRGENTFTLRPNSSNILSPLQQTPTLLHFTLIAYVRLPGIASVYELIIILCIVINEP